MPLSPVPPGACEVGKAGCLCPPRRDRDIAPYHGGSRHRLVRQFHHVEKIARVIAPADLQDIHNAAMGARDRLELEQAFELALEMLDALKALAVDNFHRAQCADGVARQPYLAISTTPDQAQQFVVGNDWSRPRGEWIARRLGTFLAWHGNVTLAGAKVECTTEILF